MTPSEVVAEKMLGMGKVLVDLIERSARPTRSGMPRQSFEIFFDHVRKTACRLVCGGK